MNYFQKTWAAAKGGFKALTASGTALQAFRDMGASFFGFPRFSQYVNGAYVDMQSAAYGHIYNTQENVRIVVDAVARYANKRALKCFNRDARGNVSEDYSFEACATLDSPNDWQSGRQLLKQFILDKLVYEDAFLWDMGGVEDGKRFLVRVPPPAMGVSTDNSLKPVGYVIRFNNGTELPLRVDEVIHWSGYNPESNRLGVSKLETLRVMLTENAVRKAHLIDMIRGGLIKGGIVKRPIEAPEWSNKARQRFEQNFSGRLRGTARGEVAMLEDGMDFMEAGITPQQAELLESKQFDLAITANIFGVNPQLFTTTGNLAQAREMLDEDVVEELLGDLADVLNVQLIQQIYLDSTHYFVFSRAKITDLNTLFEAGSKATGGAVMAQNEFRAEYLDLPPKPGGDDLAKNPGATTGSLPPTMGAAPRGILPYPPEDSGATATVKSLEVEIHEALKFKAEQAQKKADERAADLHYQELVTGQHMALLSKHFRRQKAAHQKGNAPLLNSGRWDRELSDDLRALAKEVVSFKGNQVANSEGQAFDMLQVQNYLAAGADAIASAINQRTADYVASQISMGKSVDQAYESRVKQADSLSSNRATQLISFAALEAGRQLGD